MMKNISQAINLSDMMGAFEEHLQTIESLKSQVEAAKQAYLLREELFSLHESYRKLSSAMINKILNAASATEIQRIKAQYNDKLIPVIQRIEAVQKKLDPRQLVESRQVVTDKMDRVTQLLDKVSELKEQVMGSTSPSQLLVSTGTENIPG